jgi:16S rRNA (guanine1207-N2)-methyltransferase
MTLENTSQLLVRNLAHLFASSPLLVNAPADAFLEQYLLVYPASQVTCLNFHYGEHLSLTKRYAPKVATHFDAAYRNTKLHDLVILQFPKSKAELAFTLCMIAESLTPNAAIYFVGDNKSGIKSVAKLAQGLVAEVEKIDNARHCLLYSGQFSQTTQTFKLQDWFQLYPIDIKGVQLEIAALPGVFSQNRLDTGSELLLNQLPGQLSGDVLDFGCGAGVIAAFIGAKWPDTNLTLVDVNVLALTSAKHTLLINDLSGAIIASDGLAQVDRKFQYIVSNPPFHQGIKTHYAATEQFFTHLSQHLCAKATVFIVANSFLQYQPLMTQFIGKVVRLSERNGFTIYQCHN